MYFKSGWEFGVTYCVRIIVWVVYQNIYETKNSLNLDYNSETPQTTGISVKNVNVAHHNGKRRMVLFIHYFTTLWIVVYNFTKMARLKL